MTKLHKFHVIWLSVMTLWSSKAFDVLGYHL